MNTWSQEYKTTRPLKLAQILYLYILHELEERNVVVELVAFVLRFWEVPGTSISYPVGVFCGSPPSVQENATILN